MKRERAIVHLNIADFAVAVERRIDPRLRKRPVIVAPAGAARAAVYDMSEEAYQSGVRKRMPLDRAVRRCREAVVAPPHPDRYAQAMRAVLQRALPYSPQVESGDDDGHLFVDVTGTTRLFGPPVDVAWRLGRQVRKDLGFDPIWSLAPNKLVAKVATRLVKPTGEYVVAAGEEASLLAPLPLHLLPGIERPDLLRLQAFNLSRSAQVCALSLAQLEVPCGRRARFIYETVRGIDPSPVRPAGDPPPVLHGSHDFTPDSNDAARLEGALHDLVERAGRELRGRRLTAGGLRIVCDYSDGLRRTGRATLQSPTADDRRLFEHARRLWRRTWSRRVRVRHLRLTCDRLVFPPAQRDLFAPPDAVRRDALTAAVDRIRASFGPDAVRFGRALCATDGY